MRIKFLTVISFVTCMLVSPSAHAVIFVGELSTATAPPGVESTGGIWGSAFQGFKIKWTVESLFGGNWLYQYDLTNANGDQFTAGAVSHFIIEVSDNVTLNDFWDFKKDGVAIPNSEFVLDDFDGQGGSNPNIPGSVHGVKFDTEEGKTYSVISSRGPTWGDFYTKDGNAGKNSVPSGQSEENSAWNSDFLLADPTDAPANGLLSDGQGGFQYKILRPDTTTGPSSNPPFIPEPATMALMGNGL